MLYEASPVPRTGSLWNSSKWVSSSLGTFLIDTKFHRSWLGRVCSGRQSCLSRSGIVRQSFLRNQPVSRTTVRGADASALLSMRFKSVFWLQVDLLTCGSLNRCHYKTHSNKKCHLSNWPESLSWSWWKHLEPNPNRAFSAFFAICIIRCGVYRVTQSC